MTRVDPVLPPVFTHADALAGGMTRAQIKTRAGNGSWRVLRRGVYCRAALWESSSRAGRHELTSHAALRAVRGPVWLSHASAANRYGLPLPLDDDRVWLTRQPPAGTSYLPGVVVEAATLAPADQWVFAGSPVTSLPRTVADCTRHLLPRDGLAVADAAIRRDPAIGERVAGVLARCQDWPLVERGRLVLSLADGRRESPLESWSFWLMHQHGLPLPEPQVDLFDRGQFLGRCDAWWWQFGVALEVDGRVKYDVAAGGLEAAQRALLDEKTREERIRRAGAGVIRWGAAELRRPEQWATWVARELRDHGKNRFRGTAVRHVPGRDRRPFAS